MSSTSSSVSADTVTWTCECKEVNTTEDIVCKFCDLMPRMLPCTVDVDADCPPSPSPSRLDPPKSPEMFSQKASSSSLDPQPLSSTGDAIDQTAGERKLGRSARAVLEKPTKERAGVNNKRQKQG